MDEWRNSSAAKATTGWESNGKASHARAPQTRRSLLAAGATARSRPDEKFREGGPALPGGGCLPSPILWLQPFQRALPIAGCFLLERPFPNPSDELATGLRGQRPSPAPPAGLPLLPSRSLAQQRSEPKIWEQQSPAGSKRQFQTAGGGETE